MYFHPAVRKTSGATTSVAVPSGSKRKREEEVEEEEVKVDEASGSSDEDDEASDDNQQEGELDGLSTGPYTTPRKMKSEYLSSVMKIHKCKWCESVNFKLQPQ